jgi:hypothetical protein
MDQAGAGDRPAGDEPKAQTQAQTLLMMAKVRRRQRRPDEAAELVASTLRTVRAIGDRYGEAKALEELAGVHGERGDHDQAARARQAARDIYRELGIPDTVG